MAMLPDVFNSNDHEPMTDFSPVPNDWYNFEISKSEIKATKNGKGKRLNLQAKIIGGGEEDDTGEYKYAGHIVFIGLNIQNPSAKCVEISQRELRSLCDAVGIDVLEDSVELHDISFWAKTVIEESEGYAPKNVLKSYKSDEQYAEFIA